MRIKTLTSLHLETLATIARFRLLTTEQIARAMKTQREKVASAANFANILRKLHSRGFVSRDWVPVRPDERTMLARPSAVWQVQTKHFRAIEEELKKTQRAELFEELRDSFNDLKDGEPLTENTIRHELAISDFYISLETDRARLPVWLRTSPRHALISRTVTATLTDKETGKKTKKELPLNPDGYHITDRNGHAHFFLEMDMSTESPRVISDKLIAYVAYHQQKQFGRDIATPIARRYALPLQDPENASFRVLFITQTERRRNDLLLQSRLFPMSNLFHYATMADLKRDPYGTIWYSKETIAPLVDRYDEQSHHLTAVTLRNWAHDAIAHLTPHAL